MDVASASLAGVVEPAYARFLPRVRALVIDSIVLILVMFGAVMIAIAVGSDNLARPLGFSVAIFWLLYEPLFVAFAGGTIGHTMSNLRVADDQTQGNVSFLKAVARAIVKGVLGWFSFITMLTTRRSQAVHDLLTHSTVQIRDLSKARPRQFVRERTEFDSPTMPTRPRRALAIVAYLITFTAVASAIAILVLEAGAVSDACYVYDRCTPRDEWVFKIAAALWIAGCIVLLALGWRGRLYGARKTA